MKSKTKLLSKLETLHEDDDMLNRILLLHEVIYFILGNLAYFNSRLIQFKAL